MLVTIYLNPLHMKNIKTLVTLILLVTGSITQAQSLDDILKEHFKASGQDNLLKINSQEVTGKILQSGIEIPFTQMAKRPDKVRMQGTFQGLTFIQTYNGKEGWSINPFAGVTDPQPMSDDELKSVRYQSDMDGMLWNAKEKGSTISFEGKEDMEGTSCFKIKLVTKEGDAFTYYIDSDSYIMIRANSKVKIMGNDSESDQYFGNYMQIDGIAVPGKVDTKINGQLAITMVFDSVKFNIGLEDTIFDKPVK